MWTQKMYMTLALMTQQSSFEEQIQQKPNSKNL